MNARKLANFEELDDVADKILALAIVIILISMKTFCTKLIFESDVYVFSSFSYRVGYLVVFISFHRRRHT